MKQNLLALLAFLTALLLLCFLAWRLVQPKVTSTITSTSTKSDTSNLKHELDSKVTSSKPHTTSLNLNPPILAESATIRLAFSDAQSKPRHVNAFLLSLGKQYVVTTASSMSRFDWEQVRKVEIASRQDLRLAEFAGSPQHLGDLTADQPLNMLENPDMGQDLAVWTLPASLKIPGLLPAEESRQDQIVWLAGEPLKNPQRLYQCQILSLNENMMYLRQLERFEFEELIGLPFIDQQGKVVGVLSGGGDFTLVSMSLPALRRQLEKWQMMDKQK